MKISLFLTLLLSFTSFSAFADCMTTVKNAAIEVDAQNSQADLEGLYFDAEAELYETDGTNFTYFVYVHSGLADGSDRYQRDSREYQVKGRGDAKACAVTEVKRSK